MKTLPRTVKKAQNFPRTRGAEFSNFVATSAARGPRPNSWHKVNRANPWKHFDPSQANEVSKES